MRVSSEVEAAATFFFLLALGLRPADTDLFDFSVVVPALVGDLDDEFPVPRLASLAAG